MTEVERKELEDLRETAQKWEGVDIDAVLAENARLKEANILRDATTYVTGKLTESQLPDLTKARLVKALSANPPVKDGALDEAALQTQLDEAIKSETEYIAKLTGSGRIVGMGSIGAQTQESHEGRDQLKESFRLGYLREGKSEDEAERLATLAAAGR